MFVLQANHLRKFYLPDPLHVVSDRFRYGVFRLTDPPGMQAISACRQSGVFHPHAETNIYTDALKPGHVIEAKGLDFEVVDLRP